MATEMVARHPVVDELPIFTVISFDGLFAMRTTVGRRGGTACAAPRYCAVRGFAPPEGSARFRAEGDRNEEAHIGGAGKERRRELAHPAAKRTARVCANARLSCPA